MKFNEFAVKGEERDVDDWHPYERIIGYFPRLLDH